MIKPLLLDSIKRIKWLAIAYLLLVGFYSWGKISVFIINTPIPTDDWRWGQLVLFGIAILGFSIAGTLIPYDRLTDKDSFWASKPPRPIHLVASHTLVLILVVVLPITASETLISFFWGSLSTSISVFTQTFCLLFFYVTVFQILLSGSRNPFKSIGIGVTVGIVSVGILAMIRGPKVWVTSGELSSITLSVFSLCFAVAATSSLFSIKRKSEWPHTIALIAIPILFANLAQITVKTQAHFSQQFEETTDLPYPIEATITIPTKPTTENAIGTNRVTIESDIYVSDVPPNRILITLDSILSNGKATPLKISLRRQQSLSGFEFSENEKGTLSVEQNGPVSLIATTSFSEQFRKRPPFTLKSIWLEFEVVDQANLTGAKWKHHVANGILSRLVMTQNDPLSEDSSPPVLGILQSKPRSWEKFRLPTPFFSYRGNPLPKRNSIRRINHVEYEGGSTWTYLTPENGRNDDSVFPMMWRVTPIRPYQDSDPRRHLVATVAHTIDLKLVGVWRSSIEAETQE